MSRSWEPDPGQIDQAKNLWTADDVARERQDFLAGTVWADAAGVAFAGDEGQLFLLMVHDNDHTYLPAPQIREAFDLLDKVGSAHASASLNIAPVWAVMVGPPEESLVKLTLTFNGPMTGKASIVLAAGNYAELWRHIADGGVVGVTTRARINAVQQPGSGLTPAEACVMVLTQSSPALRALIDRHGWATP